MKSGDIPTPSHPGCEPSLCPVYPHTVHATASHLAAVCYETDSQYCKCLCLSNPYLYCCNSSIM